MAPTTEGTWGGLLLLGNAVTTAGTDATAEVGGLIYGGDDNADNSGSIEYLIIKKSGAEVSSDWVLACNSRSQVRRRGARQLGCRPRGLL